MGAVLVGRSADLSHGLSASLDLIGRVPFPYVSSSPEAQAAAMVAALQSAGVGVTQDGSSFVEDSGGSGNRVLGVATAFDPKGLIGPLPWEIAIETDDVSVCPSCDGSATPATSQSRCGCCKCGSRGSSAAHGAVLPWSAWTIGPSIALPTPTQGMQYRPGGSVPPGLRSPSGR
jgi:hypothetical protein